MLAQLRNRKHVWLLTTLVVLQAVQPLLAHESVPARIFSTALMLAAGAAVFSAVLAPGWQRRLALALVLPAVAIELAHYAFAQRHQPTLAVVHHLSLVLFLAFAVSIILRNVFHKLRLAIDDVVGAFAGYLMTAVLWGNLYALTWLLVPGSFSVAPQITSQLTEWDTRRALFDYFSFATLASVGYGDVVTTAPVSNTLVWLEVMSGQFYLAVVVATIVGMKLAQAVQSERPE